MFCSATCNYSAEFRKKFVVTCGLVFAVFCFVLAAHFNLKSLYLLEAYNLHVVLLEISS